MPTTLPTQRGIDPAATTPMPTVDATLHLSARTLSWLARRPQARQVVNSAWDTPPSAGQACSDGSCSEAAAEVAVLRHRAGVQ